MCIDIVNGVWETADGQTESVLATVRSSMVKRALKLLTTNARYTANQKTHLNRIPHWKWEVCLQPQKCTYLNVKFHFFETMLRTPILGRGYVSPNPSQTPNPTPLRNSWLRLWRSSHYCIRSRIVVVSAFMTGKHNNFTRALALT